MKRLFLSIAALALPASAVCAEAPRMLDRANVLPLALDDSFQFRKTTTLLNDPTTNKPTIDPTINFERQRLNFGAVGGYDRRQRYGEYFNFYWRALRRANVTFRLEYRTQNLGAHVQAQEVSYNDVKGSVKTEFKVVGDDYQEDGKITGWRAVIIENGKIVGLHQSFLWN